MRAGLSSGATQVVGELLEFHQLLKALVHGESQVFSDQCDINVLLVRLNDGMSPLPLERIEILLELPLKPGLLVAG